MRGDAIFNGIIIQMVFEDHDPPHVHAIYSGAKALVRISDGEVIRGVAHYNPERNGFFLFPHDRSKNDRIFVVNSAIVSIEVEKL